MHRMNSPENKSAPELETSTNWMRRRWRALLGVLLLFALFALISRRFSVPPQQCQHARDCHIKCPFGKPYCASGHGAITGGCGCRTREEEEARLTPPRGCRDAVLRSDDGDQLDWSCSGFDPPDGGDGGTTP